MPYEPTRVPSLQDEGLAQYLDEEFSKIAESFVNIDFIQLVERHSPPEKIRTGMTVLADGTDWNPGSGQGVYTYYNGQWNKLG